MKRHYTKIPFAQRSERFLAKFDRSGGPDACWHWLGCCNPDGYGATGFRLGFGILQRAHVVVFVLEYRVIPSHWGLCVLHSCDNPPCGNPRHLFLGTQADNNADKTAKGRQASKLSKIQVAEIRKLCGEHTPKYLARRFGVTSSHIWRITTGKLWKEREH
jgi:hypothetical protein